MTTTIEIDETIDVVTPNVVSVSPDAFISAKITSSYSYQGKGSMNKSTNHKTGGDNRNGYFRRGERLIDSPIVNITINPNIEADINRLIESVKNWKHFEKDINKEKIDDAIANIHGAVRMAQESFTTDNPPMLKNWTTVHKIQTSAKIYAVVYKSTKFPDRLWRALFVRRSAL